MIIPYRITSRYPFGNAFLIFARKLEIAARRSSGSPSIYSFTVVAALETIATSLVLGQRSKLDLIPRHEREAALFPVLPRPLDPFGTGEVSPYALPATRAASHGSPCR